MTSPVDEAGPARKSSSPVHTVLIHGGSHGAWCWWRVQTELRHRGLVSSSFDLPGSGDDRTPREAITTGDLVDAVIAHIDGLGVDRVRIVGHSIAGWLLPPVAARLNERNRLANSATRPSNGASTPAAHIEIVELVFVAAATLNRAESGFDVTPQQRRPGYYFIAEASSDNSLLGDFQSCWDRFFQHLNEPRARATYALLTPQAFGPYLSPAEVGIEEVSCSRRYIAMDEDRTYPLDVTRAFAGKAGVEPLVIPGDHCVMLSAAAVLADAIADGDSE